MNAQMHHQMHHHQAQVEIEIDAAQAVPIACPACSAPLGEITAAAGIGPAAWERERIPLSVLQVDASRLVRAELLRGSCPACSADLAAFALVFRRSRGSDNPDTARLSIAVHGRDTWAMLERRASGVEIVEHAIGPLLDRDAGSMFAALRTILPAMSGLPAAGAG